MDNSDLALESLANDDLSQVDNEPTQEQLDQELDNILAQTETDISQITNEQEPGAITTEDIVVQEETPVQTEDNVVQEEPVVQTEETQEINQAKKNNDVDGTGEKLEAPTGPVQEDLPIKDDITAQEEVAPVQKSAKEDHENGVTQTEELPVQVAQESLAPYRSVGGFESIIQSTSLLASSVGILYNKLEQKTMIKNLADVAKTYSLSAPVVATMKAIPSFSTALESFPDTSLFNIIPETKQSTKLSLGLESLTSGIAETAIDCQTKMWNVIDNFSKVVCDLNDRLPVLQTRIDNAKADLNAANIDEEALALVPVNTLSDEAFNASLDMVDQCLNTIGAFNSDDLRANPEGLQDQYNGMVSMTEEMGAALGIAVDSNSLVCSTKGPDFEPTLGNFGDKNISKSSLEFYLGKASAIVSRLSDIVAKREELTEALRNESNDLPNQDDSNDVAYGCDAHLRLMGSYAMLVSKLTEEAVVLTSRITSVVDTVLENQAPVA
jgi:hypothetical protein